MMLALVRPDSWNLPLFLHVLGAITVFGASATLAIAGFAGRRDSVHEQMLARVALRTSLFGVIPAWILMRFAAEWIAGKEFPDGVDTPGWVGVGYIVSEGSGVLLLVAGILAWLSVRRGRMMVAVPILATVCVLGYAVAWFVMSGKP
jgi:hypothetical protein